MARILVVDDEEAIREFLAECLRTQRYLVIEEADGDAALRRLEAESFDLLITDLRMPGRSGLELLAEARGRWPEMETLLITALRDEAHRFAITFHRRRRGRVASELDDVPGVGPSRRRLLLRHFGSLSGLRQASRDEVRAVPGVPRAVADAVFDRLQRR